MQREAIEQEAVVNYCRYMSIPIFAIPNGGRRNPKEAYFMRKSGVSAGVPDLFVPLARNGYHGLFVEMKAGKNKPTVNQIEWLALLQRNGYAALVCYGADEAIKTITKYITISGTSK